MRLGAALLQHPLPIGPLLSVTRLKDDLVLLSFGQRLAFFGNHTGRSCVVCALGWDVGASREASQDV